MATPLALGAGNERGCHSEHPLQLPRPLGLILRSSALEPYNGDVHPQAEESFCFVLERGTLAAYSLPEELYEEEKNVERDWP